MEEQRVVFRRYRILRELGRGGTGVVFLARDEELGIDVALKLLPDLVFQDDEALIELKREVLRGMALTHPGIVRTYEFVRDENMAAIVMEYVDGGDFSQLKGLQPGGCFDTEELLPWLEHLCPILDFAHFEARVAHCDLKPGNLMYTLAGNLKVADFGISSALEESVSRVSVHQPTRGTPAYMSPQQVMGASPSHLDDIYSLGATIYDLITGAPPFQQGQVVTGIMDRVVPAMTVRRAELGVTGKNLIPPAWERTVAACLEKDPSQRPQSAGEVLAWLKLNETARPRLLVGSGGGSSHGRSPISVPPRRKRQGLMVALAAGVGALLAFVLWPRGRPEAGPPASLDPAREAAAAATDPGGAPPHPVMTSAEEPVVAEAEIGEGVTQKGMRDTGLPPAKSTALDLAAAKPGDRRTVDLGDGLQIVFCGIPAGKFLMGSPSAEQPGKPDETQHEVTLTRAFWMARTEVTQAQWEAVMGSNPSYSKGRNLPVEQVSWTEAAEFCLKLAERERTTGMLPRGWEFALPTEAQWEYACRAGTTGRYGGNMDIDRMGWHGGNSTGNTHPVGVKEANAWGLADMHGNVWEWCADWHGDYSFGNMIDPTGPVTGGERVHRGGSCLTSDDSCRAANRIAVEPGRRSRYLGFRPVLVLSRSPGPMPDVPTIPGQDPAIAEENDKLSESAVEFRRWTSTAGTIIEAQALELLPETRSIRLRLRNGKKLDVQLAQLSEADRVFAAAWKPKGVQRGATIGLEWTVVDDEQSSEDRNGAIDLVRIALRRLPDKPASIEFLASYRKGTPDRGKLSLLIDADRDPATGPSGEELGIFVELDKMEPKAVVEGYYGGRWQPVSHFPARAERLQDQILVRVDGGGFTKFKFTEFNYRVLHSAFVQQRVELPCPTDQTENTITVDGKVDDWDGMEPGWTATEAELPITYCLADPRNLWACRKGGSLFLRARFPANGVLWEQDGDVVLSSSGVGISVLPSGTDYQDPKLWCTLPDEVIGGPAGKAGTPAPAVFQWSGSEMEIEVRNIPPDLVAAQIYLLFHSQKIDEIGRGVFRSK